MELKGLKCIQNDVVANFNNAIRIVHCGLKIESTQPGATLIFQWALNVTKINLHSSYTVGMHPHLISTNDLCSFKTNN